MDTIARVCHEFHVQRWSLKRIVREQHVSRNTMRKILRSDETDYSYNFKFEKRCFPTYDRHYSSGSVARSFLPKAFLYLQLSYDKARSKAA